MRLDFRSRRLVIPIDIHKASSIDTYKNIWGASYRTSYEVKILDKKILKKKLWKIQERGPSTIKHGVGVTWGSNSRMQTFQAKMSTLSFKQLTVFENDVPTFLSYSCHRTNLVSSLLLHQYIHLILESRPLQSSFMIHLNIKESSVFILLEWIFEACS